MTTENKPTAPLSADELDEICQSWRTGMLSGQAAMQIISGRVAGWRRSLTSPPISSSVESLSRASGEERGQQAPQASVEDARDAARYREVRMAAYKYGVGNPSPDQLDIDVDAAMSATQEGK